MVSDKTKILAGLYKAQHAIDKGIHEQVKSGNLTHNEHHIIKEETEILFGQIRRAVHKNSSQEITNDVNEVKAKLKTLIADANEALASADPDDIISDENLQEISDYLDSLPSDGSSNN